MSARDLAWKTVSDHWNPFMDGWALVELIEKALETAVTARTEAIAKHVEGLGMPTLATSIREKDYGGA